MCFLFEFAIDLIILNGLSKSSWPDIKVINPPACTILESWVFYIFILADEQFAKALRGFETCVTVNNNLCRKLVSSLELPITFDEKSKVKYHFLLLVLIY